MAEALSLVERGWQGARECSLALDRAGVRVTHLVKGSLSGEVRAMIEPHPRIRIVDVPRPLFRWALWAAVLGRTLRGRPRWVLLDHERAARELAWWARRFGVTLVFVEERQNRIELSVDGRPSSFREIFGCAPPAALAG